MSQSILTNNDISSLDSGKLTMTPLSGYTSTTQGGFNIELSNKITGLTATVTNNFGQRDMLTTSQTIINNTGATVSPDFTDGVYKCTSNYAGGSAISISTFTNIPLFDTCKTVYIKNTKGSDITAALATTQTVGSIVYTFINMKDNTNAAVTIPTTKTLEISYMFTYTSSISCNVEVIYLIQN